MAKKSSVETPSLDTFLNRFRKFVRARFGFDATYSPLDSMAESNRELVMDLMMNAPLVGPEGLQFPVFQAFQLRGVVQIPIEEAGQKSEIIDLVELFLDGPLALTDRLETLERVESSLAQPVAFDSNVIPFRRDPVITGLHLRSRSRLALSQPCLIEGPNRTELTKLAKEVHDLSGRFAMVPFHDLSLNSAQELLDLGPITILIEDLTTLSRSDQELLHSFLDLRQDGSSPQIVACSTEPYADLRASENLSMDFLYSVSACYLKMDRELSEYRRDGVLELFFSGLTQRLNPHWN